MAAPHLPVPLRDPALSAFLAWLIPGAGHIYQRRYAKGVMISVCILGTFMFGLVIGDGRVVYASWKPDHRRLHYLSQVGAGLVALPALVQAQRVRGGKEPLWDGWYAPPRDKAALDAMHKRLHRYFELGTVYTMVAGLLNILAIYDAFGGPAYVREEDDDEQPPDDEGGKRDKPPE